MVLKKIIFFILAISFINLSTFSQDSNSYADAAEDDEMLDAIFEDFAIQGVSKKAETIVNTPGIVSVITAKRIRCANGC